METALTRYGSPVYAIVTAESVWLRSRHGVLRLNASPPVTGLLLNEPDEWHNAPGPLRRNLMSRGIMPRQRAAVAADSNCTNEISLAATGGDQLEYPVIDLAASSNSPDRADAALVHFHVGHRIMLGVLRNGSPCPDCLVIRLRATYPFRAIADAPLSDIFDPPQMHSDSSHRACSEFQDILRALLAEVQRRPHGVLFEMRIKKTRASIRLRPILPLPGCRCCREFSPLRPAAPPRGAPQEEDARPRYDRLVDACTGIVGGIRIRTHGAGRLFDARTWTRLDTTRFSAARAQVGGAAVRLQADDAIVAALGEALERYAAGVVDPGRLRSASFAGVRRHAVDPVRLLHLGPILSGASPLAAFDPDQQIRWTTASDVTGAITRLVPAACVFLPYPASPHERFTRPNSTGLAAGSTATGATTRALLEVIERYSWRQAWSRRRVRQRLDVGPCCQDTQRLIGHIGNAATFLWAADISLSSATPAVIAGAIGGSSLAPSLSLGVRAAFSLHDALVGALREVAQSQLHVKTLLESRPVPGTADEVRTLDDLYLFYCNQERLRQLEFLWNSDVPAAATHHRSVADRPAGRPRPLGALRRTIHDAGLDAWIADLTPADLRFAGVTVVRALLSERDECAAPPRRGSQASVARAACPANDLPPPLLSSGAALWATMAVEMFKLAVSYGVRMRFSSSLSKHTSGLQIS
jgi:thiazole/oxazole-forming peptide maturase SagD family component